MKREMTIQSIISWIFIGLYAVPFVTVAKIDENTVALWLFDEGSGDVVKDFSGNGNNGKIFEAEWAPGKFGDALKFDGIADQTDYVEAPSPSLVLYFDFEDGEGDTGQLFWLT
jgi:hypothetical protein